MSDPNALITPYFPIYSTTAPADILNSSISAVLGGSNPALQPDEEWPRCSICEEHLIPYLQVNVSSPQTPSEFRQRVSVRPKPGHSVILQVFICADDESATCFQESIVSGGGEGDRPAFLVRVVQIAPDAVNSAAVQATRGEMDEEKFFVEQRVITAWAAGNPEMAHEEGNYGYDEELYERHAPADGLKLLGYPVQGKFFSSYHESCPRVRGGDDNAAQNDDGGDVEAAALLHEAEAYGPWRCLLQLGTSTEDENAPLCVVGNTWINQCEHHPDVLSMTIGGNW
ncbi:hypothetical protein C8Q80DRAFT_557253 [Daedaleopsis nitida]|nr:hypothetical protein C8Q80DRAFT_557253 [Daedaleopsis nitida]